MSFARYPKYKDSGVEWLGQVPEHWDVKRLKHCTQLVTAKADERTNPVALENIEGWTGRLIPSEGDYQGEGTAFVAGDILFGKLRPYLAKVHLASQPGEAVGDFHVLRPYGGFDGHFAQYRMLTHEFIDIVDGSTYGSRMPRASWEFVGGMPMALPPAKEQTAIATLLDRETAKIDALIAEQQRLIELLQEKRQAVISHAVTKGLNPDAPMKDSGIEWLGEVPEHWEVVALKHLVAQPIIDGPHESPQKQDDGIPFVSAESIGKGFVDFDKKWGYISQQDHDRYSQRYKPQRGDILLVKLGATTGVPAIVETDIEFNVWVPLAAMRLKSTCQPRFIFHVLRSNNLRVAYELNWTYGTQQTLGLGTISNLRVPVPPSNERRSVVELLDSVLPGFDALEAEARTAISLLQERRSALISAAVTGQIDVREYASEGAAA
jgi:type I restriction enzyme S subunit